MSTYWLGSMGSNFSAGTCTAGYEKLELSTAKRYGVQRQYQGKDSLIASLEEKYVLSQCECEMPDNSSSSSESPEHLPQEPLHMLGGMVSPHLVQAKASPSLISYSSAVPIFCAHLDLPQPCIYFPCAATSLASPFCIACSCGRSLIYQELRLLSISTLYMCDAPTLAEPHYHAGTVHSSGKGCGDNCERATLHGPDNCSIRRASVNSTIAQ